MLSIMTTIILVCVSLVALVALVVLFVPFRFSTEFALSTDTGSGAFLAHWIHPRIFGIRYDFERNLTELTIFGWRLKTKARDADVNDKSAEQAASAKETGAVKKDPVLTKPAPVKPAPVEPARQTIQPAIPVAEVPPKSSASTVSDDKPGAPRQSIRSRFAQFRKRMSFHWRRLQTSWRILQRYQMASRALRWCLRLLSLSARSVRLDHVRINVKAGLKDPADLGKIYGWYAAGNRLLFGGRKNIMLGFEPQFMRNSLALNGSVGLQTSVARVLMPLVIGLLTFPWLRAFFVWRRLKTIYQSEPPGDIIT
jgi:hypothetical protein